MSNFCFGPATKEWNLLYGHWKFLVNLLSVQNGLVTKLMVVFAMLYSKVWIRNKIGFLGQTLVYFSVQKRDE